MPGLESQGWRSRFPSSDARLTQARTHSGLHGGGQRESTLSLQGRNRPPWRNLLSSGETVQLHPQAPGGCAPRGERAGPAASGGALPGPGPPTFPLRGPVVTRWQWSISVRLWGSLQPWETPPNLPFPEPLPSPPGRPRSDARSQPTPVLVQRDPRLDLKKPKLPGISVALDTAPFLAEALFGWEKKI